MKVFVAGATGAIGRPLVRQLIADHYDVIALARSEEASRRMNAAGVQAEIADVFDGNAVRDLLSRVRPEVVINQLRAMPKRYNADSMRAAAEPDRKVRELGGGNLESAAKEIGVKRYILQSCAFWYAPGPVGSTALADEDTEFAFNAPPQIASGCKLYQEMERRAFSTLGPAVVIVRYGFFYGPGTYNAKDGDVSEQVRNRKYPLIGGGSGVWSWVHVDDAARGTATLAAHGPAGVYNLVDDNPSLMAEWLPAYARWLDAPPPPKVPTDQVKDESLIYYATQLRGASNAKAKQEIGFQPRALEWLAVRATTATSGIS
jgi:nucleoside-diphosphate-sugar epimerase